MVKRVGGLRSIIWRIVLLKLTAAIRIHERPYFLPSILYTSVFIFILKSGRWRCSNFGSWNIPVLWLPGNASMSHGQGQMQMQMSTKNPAASKWLLSTLKNIFSCIRQHNPDVGSLREKYRFLLHTLLHAPRKNFVQWRWRWISVRRQKYFALDDPVRRCTLKMITRNLHFVWLKPEHRKKNFVSKFWNTAFV